MIKKKERILLNDQNLKIQWMEDRGVSVLEFLVNRQIGTTRGLSVVISSDAAFGVARDAKHHASPNIGEPERNKSNQYGLNEIG